LDLNWGQPAAIRWSHRLLARFIADQVLVVIEMSAGGHWRTIPGTGEVAEGTLKGLRLFVLAAFSTLSVDGQAPMRLCDNIRGY
jgi:hypothetical protein